MKKIGKLLLVAVLIFILIYQSKQTNTTINEYNVINKAKEPFTIVAQNLEIPWQTLFLPDNKILITERVGKILLLDETNATRIEVAGVKHIGEGGLLGAAIHPNFEDNKFLYLYYTLEQEGTLLNRVYRYVLQENTLTQEKLIVDGINGARNHDGGRIAFGPDGLLYITTGDAQNESLAQDTNSLNGKILRVGDDGSIPQDNPFSNAVYSYGHRNPQGLTWDAEGNLWSTEHGPSGLSSGWDELNIIKKGSNYGWPQYKGDINTSGIASPVIHSGASDTWAPASAAYLNGSIYFGGLRGQTLYEYNIATKRLTKHYESEFGRIRDVSINNKGEIFFTTSNTDDRGLAKKGDDKLIKINN